MEQVAAQSVSGEAPDRLNERNDNFKENFEMNFAAISQYLKLRMNRDEKGVTTIEYAVMIVLVAGVVVIFGPSLSGAITGVFSSIAAKL